MGFVQTYFIAFALDEGFTRWFAAGLMGLMGLLSVVGGLGLGTVSDRVGRRDPLALAYLLRGLGFAAWSAIPIVSRAEVLMALGIVLIGLSWAATTSLTTAACADVWGSGKAGAIAGLALFVMWIGHGIGSYVPGLVRSTWGTYIPTILANELGALVAAVMVFTLREPTLRRAPESALTP